MSPGVWLAIASALTASGALVGVVWAKRRSSPESQATIITAVTPMVKELWDRSEKLEAELKTVRAEVRTERERADEWERAARRLRDMPATGHPMSQFIADGWLHALNEDIAVPLGVRMGIYVDDIDGQVALAYDLSPIDPDYALNRTPPPRATEEARARRERAALIAIQEHTASKEDR